MESLQQRKLPDHMIKNALREQQNEINAHYIYKELAESEKNQKNQKVLERISKDEMKHYEILKSFTGQDVKPQTLVIKKSVGVAKVFGLTFGLKLLEMGEISAQSVYQELSEEDARFIQFLEDEERHEIELIDMLHEERLNYVGSVVLGLNDALVELTGALAGYTFAFQNTRLIALTGLITGISASFSMAASEYLSSKQDEDPGEARKSALYTGIAYIITVMLLILPFLLIHNPFVSLGVSLAVAVTIIFVFNFYISVAKSLNFKERFLEMAAISLGVSGISFLIGVLVKNVIGIDL